MSIAVSVIKKSFYFPVLFSAQRENFKKGNFSLISSLFSKGFPSLQN